MGRSAIILGPTGLTGTELLKQLLVDSRYSEVKAFTRRSINIKHKKLKQYIVDFDLLDQHKQDFTADDVFCCLGTTMKKAKTKSQFRKVDFEIPSLAAQMALGQGAKQLMLISALGSNPSSIFFYNRVKGELEERVMKLPFQSIHIFRPSLLIGEREETRAGEKAAEWLCYPFTPLLRGSLEKYRPIKGITVAQAMIRTAIKDIPGIHIYDSKEIQDLIKNK